MPVFRDVCSFCETDGFVLVSLSDSFLRESWNRLESALEDLIDGLRDANSKAILLNLSALQCTSSAVVTATLRIWKQLSSAGNRIVVYAPSEEARTTMRLAGVSKLMTVVSEADDGLDVLGVSRNARDICRETALLKYISPIAAAGAVSSLIAVLLSISPDRFRPLFLFVLITTAMMASYGGWLSAARERGAFRNVSRLVSATGFATLLTAIGLWSA